MRYIIKGNPVPLARPRFGRNRVYDKQKELKLIAGIDLKAQNYGNEPLAGSLKLNATFFLPIPRKSISKTRGTSKLDNKLHAHRPDLDNLIKFLLDVAQSCNLIQDDGCISMVEAIKRYAINPRTEFEFVRLEGE